MELFEEKKRFMERAAAYMNEKYGESTVELKLEDSYFNMKQQIEPHMHLVDNVLAVYEKLGIQPQVLPIRGGTDAPSFPLKDCPARIWEPGTTTATDILNLYVFSPWKNASK